MRTAQELFDELCALDESASIEAKTAAGDDSSVARSALRSVLETVCAFANEPALGGGYLLLGVAPTLDPAMRYEVVGVADPDRVQSDLVTRCASAFNRPLRPVVRVEQLHDKTVIVAFVPEAAPTDKPIFLTALGLPRGAFRRIGPTDHHGTEDDVRALFQAHRNTTLDSSAVDDAELTDLDPEALRAYRAIRARVSPDAEELRWSDEELLQALHAVVPVAGTLRPTVAGLLLFGTSLALRRCFPMMRIDYLRIPGRRWIEDPERPFDAVEIRAPLVLAVPRAVAAVMDDLPVTFSLPEGELVREDRPTLPRRVVREAIVNAVMHRSYGIHSPIQILRYANRLEIRNAGHSLKPVDQLGQPGSATRNPRIAAVMHDLRLAESKGSGIRVMRDLMRAHGLEPPALDSSRHADHFVATFLFHHFLDEADLAWLRALTAEPLSAEDARALIFVREVGAIDNAVFRAFGTHDTLSASTHLRRLRDLGLLEMRGSGSRTYYLPGPVMVAQTPKPGSQTHEFEGQTPMGDTDRHQRSPDLHQAPGDHHHPTPEARQPGDPTHKLNAQAHKLGGPTHNPPLPEALQARLASAGRRPPRAVVVSLLVDLCAHRAMSARELSAALGGRDPRDLTRTYLRPLIDRGQLAYTVPQMPNHPDQKYTTPPPPSAEEPPA